MIVQNIDEFKDTKIDIVVTVCGHAHENCPVFPGNCKVVHVAFNDPPKMAKEFTEQETQLNCYRKVRDEIRDYVQTLPKSLS